MPNTSEFPPIYNSTQPNIVQTLPSSLAISYGDKVNSKTTYQSTPATDITAADSASQGSYHRSPSKPKSISQNTTRQSPDNSFKNLMKIHNERLSYPNGTAELSGSTGGRQLAKEFFYKKTDTEYQRNNYHYKLGNPQRRPDNKKF